MADEIGASRIRAPRKALKAQCVGLLSSGAATTALALTYCVGNRDVGFGRSVSEAEQSILLILASLLFVGFTAAYVLPRLRAIKSQRRGRAASVNVRGKSK